MPIGNLLSKGGGAVGKVIKSGFGAIRDIVDDVNTTDEERGEIQAKLERIEAETVEAAQQHEEKMASYQRDVLLAEIGGESWLQRNWRPLLMMVFILILFNNFVVAPYVAAFSGYASIYLEFPNLFWQVMTIGVGGYIGGRTYEKVKGAEAPKAKSERAEVKKRLADAKYDLDLPKPAPPMDIDNRGGG
jgi:hypothetical protein